MRLDMPPVRHPATKPGWMTELEADLPASPNPATMACFTNHWRARPTMPARASAVIRC